MSGNTEPGVQGLRGIASLMVLAYHLSIAASVPLGLWLFGWGYTGVDLFFVLSGYLLTRKFIRGDYSRGGRFTPGPYYLRRIARIWPLYYLTLPLFLVVLAAPPTWLDLVFGQDYLQSTFAFVPTWTLCIEEAFYIALPIWALAYRSRWWPHMTVSLGILSVAWGTYATASGPDFYLMAQLPAYAFTFGMGAVAARGFALRLPSWTVLGAVVISAPCLVLLQNSAVQPAWAAVLFYLVLVNARDAAALAHPAVALLGQIAYPVYLLGLPVEVASRWATPDPWLWVPLTIGATIGGAWILSVTVEAPLIRWGRRLEARLWP